MNLSDLELRRRHTASHIMSAAIMQLYPEASRGVGPWTDEGFYQDFDFGEHHFSADEFKSVMKKIRWIINKDMPIVRHEVSVDQARQMFASDPYKLELIEEIEAKGETVSLYAFGEGDDPFYIDLCAGPHLESTGEVGLINLTRVAGAYWRGDSDRAMLTRVSGVAFETQEDLDAYYAFLEEAHRRDHRKLGQELGLFTFSDLVGPGLPLFTPKGTLLRDLVANKIQEIQSEMGYQKVAIPHITKRDLYETSGHWDKFKEDLFHVTGKSDTEFVIKPMNCPHHTQIYASRPRSYRDLPVRYSEVTTCYRDELPGELLGLSRVRGLTQDDGHCFCTLDQVHQECENILLVIKRFYSLLGMWNPDEVKVSLSVRDPSHPEKYLGDTEHWDQAEQTLAAIATEQGLDFERAEGEAAFYGPKLDFMFHDALGRGWQLATCQLDFFMPERFGLEYTAASGEKVTPVMIHRAIAGSLERFLSVIIEHFAGAFPLWLSPVQAVILPVTAEHEDYARVVLTDLRSAGVRVEVMPADETLGKRIRTSQMQKTPLTLVVGDQEVADGTIALRTREDSQQQDSSVAEVIRLCHESGSIVRS